MGNTKIKKLLAVMVTAALVGGAGLGGYPSVAQALASGQEGQAEDEAVPEKTTQATMSSVNLELHTSSTKALNVFSFDLTTSLLDLVLDSAEELVETSFYEDKIAVDIDPYLNIREEANGESEILGVLYSGSYAVILEEGEEWTKIESGGITGYVHNDYILHSEEAEKLADEKGTESVLVKDEEIKIYEKQDLESEVVGTAEEGDILPIVLPETEETDETVDADAAETDLTDVNSDLDVNDEADAEEEKVKPADILKETFTEWVPVLVEEQVEGYIPVGQVEFVMVLDEAVSMEEILEKQQADEEKLQDELDTKKEAEEKKAGQQANEQEKVSSKPVETETKNEVQTSTGTDSSANTNSGSTDSGSVSVDNSDEYLLACLVYCEAGNQSYEGQLAVANVVLNRVRASGFGGSISDVIYQSGQFSPVTNGSLSRTLNNGPSSSAKQAAADALAGNNNIGSYLYFNGYVDTSTVGSYTVIGDHTFYNY